MWLWPDFIRTIKLTNFLGYKSSNCIQKFDRQKLTHTRRATCKLLELVSDSFVLHNKLCSNRQIFVISNLTCYNF